MASLYSKMIKREREARKLRTHNVLVKVGNDWRYYTFGLSSTCTDFKEFAGRTTKEDAESYLKRDPDKYRIELAE